MAEIETYFTSTEIETQTLGMRFGKTLLPNAVVAFYGELGAGKTTFIKGLVYGAAHFPIEEISSPTFNYLHIYRGDMTVFHFDLYRLMKKEDFLFMGFDEWLFKEGISCIEWSERIEDLLPEKTVRIIMSHFEGTGRRIEVKR